MFGAPHEASEDEKKAHEQQTNRTVMVAGAAAVALWVTPMIWNIIKKQWR